MSSNQVCPTAIISDSCKMGSGVVVKSFCVIGEVIIGDGVIIHPHVVIEDGVRIGNDTEIFAGTILGKEPKGSGATARQPEFEKTLIVGSECSIGPHAVVYYDVRIGQNTLIGDGASIREKCSIGNFCIISRYVTINYNTAIGDRCKIMDLTHITGNMTIEADVFISVLVATTNDNVVTAGYADHIVGPTLKEHSIVGASATLLPGVEVGREAMVAAGAVVTKNVATQAVVMGSPARPKHHVPCENCGSVPTEHGCCENPAFGNRSSYAKAT